jgi:hypothetical protein
VLWFVLEMQYNGKTSEWVQRSMLCHTSCYWGSCRRNWPGASLYTGKPMMQTETELKLALFRFLQLLLMTYCVGYSTS